MNKQLEIYKRLHGKHTCRHVECQTMVLGDYCLVHIESGFRSPEFETAEKPQKLPKGETTHDQQ
jgi:hypothetical protein